MSAPPQTQFFTLDEYFALERASERRFEYRDGEVVCMSGGSHQHAQLCRNLIRRLGNSLDGTSCQVFGSDLAVELPAAPPYRYPDVSVVCGQASFRDIYGLDVLQNPLLIVEVLSPTSEAYDRVRKFEQYCSVPSFAEYLLVAQDRPQVTQRLKRDDGNWSEGVIDNIDAAVMPGTLNCALKMREVYESVEW